MLDKLLLILGINHLDIEEEGSLYLRRYYLYRGKHRPHIYLHHIMRSDYDRALHDHPWPFTSFMLWGGYTEVVPFKGTSTAVVEHKYHAPAIIRHKATDRHRLILQAPVWTLVFAGPREREWGFWTEQGWVKWDLLKEHLRNLMP